MKAIAADAPEISDAACKKATGKSLQDWYRELDGVGLDKGRRELVNHVYAGTQKQPTIEHLITGMKVLDKSFKGREIPRFIGFPDNRDFFYLMRKKK